MAMSRRRRSAAEPDLTFTTDRAGLDRPRLGLRPGNNIVLQVNNLADYRPLVN